MNSYRALACLAPRDPARKVKVPANLRESDKTTLNWEQLRRALSALDLRDEKILIDRLD
ncbi:MAG TPA: hypothetical protein VG759_16710 [Candidatus Angelobacter sp.]|nr:hypothetical protein [Candidatus Angelobacter sp.]